MASKDLKIPNSISGKPISSDSKLLLGYLLGSVKFAEPELLDIDEIISATGMDSEHVSEGLLELLKHNLISRGGEKSFMEMSHCRVSLELVVTPGGAGVNKSGQQLLGVEDQLSESVLEWSTNLTDDGEERREIDGTPHYFTVTAEIAEDLEGLTGKWCLNVWRLDDHGDMTLHLVQGQVFDTKDEAIFYAYGMCEPVVALGVLPWLGTLTDDVPATDDDPPYVFIGAGTFDLALEAIETTFTEEREGLKWDVFKKTLDDAATADVVEWHGRCYAVVGPDHGSFKEYIGPDELPAVAAEAQEGAPSIVEEDPTPAVQDIPTEEPKRRRGKKIAAADAEPAIEGAPVEPEPEF